jgi:uncharacterized protein YycO
MIYEHAINGLKLKTGDIICTTNAGAPLAAGQFWRLVGMLIPGRVDHVAIYTGPKGRCVEAGPKGVIAYEVTNGTWDSAALRHRRGELLDTLVGVAYPLHGRMLAEKEEDIREAVASYCLAQAAAGKPYNLNFLDSRTEAAFYCSQLAYLAYLPHKIDLNTGRGIYELPGTENIIYPQEIWSGCVNKEA